MKTPSWRTKTLALLQLILVLPPLASGSICMSMAGAQRLEPGLCACTMVSTGTAEMSISAAPGADCGPCWDVAFNALKSAQAPAPLALGLAQPFALPNLAAFAPPVAGARTIWVGEPPGMRLPILRC